MTFNGTFFKSKWKDRTSSIKKPFQALNKLRIDIGKEMKVGYFKTDFGFVNLHLTKGTHWVVELQKVCIDSFVCPPPIELPVFKRKNQRNFLFAEKFQEN